MIKRMRSQSPLQSPLNLLLLFAIYWNINANTYHLSNHIQIDNVQECLSRKYHTCNVSTVQCHINQKDCLNFAIPPNTHSYASIKCCLWCCLQYNANRVHADLVDFLFTPEGLGNPRAVTLTKKSILKKTKFSFFAVKNGSIKDVSMTPQPNAVVMISTNKAAEYEYQHEEMPSSSSITMSLKKRPWILRYFTPSFVASSVTASRSGVEYSALGGGGLLAPARGHRPSSS